MIGTTLRNYKIIEKLGAGGQGTVYKALDQRLGRTVIIKVLPEELTAKELNLKRFEREARLASALDHPNICTIFDLNEINGVHFISMQYIEGRNVRQLVKGRPLELQSAVSIAIQVADALAAAHARGIIHRDIKAGNVIVTDQGQAKVLDFGLAKLLDEDAARSSGIHDTELTEGGVPYGTATYAAPEQARGARVDSRADIFSTGVLLYEMLTGSWPFRGKTVADVRHAVINEEPIPIEQARRSPVPSRLVAIVKRALKKNPADRYQRIEQFRDDLRDVARELSMRAGTNGVQGAGLVRPRHVHSGNPVSRAFRWLKSATGATHVPPRPTAREASLGQDTPSTSSEKERKSVAILPFKNLGHDPDLKFYEFSLADAVITELAQVKSIIVRPSSVIVRYQDQMTNAAKAGQELNVDAVLTAGFLRAGERLRVTAQLLDMRDNEILWSESIDADASDVITLQDDIVQHIVGALRLELSPDEKEQLSRKMRGHGAASEEYLRGRNCLAQFIYHTISRDHLDAAIEHFKTAIEYDDNYALAYSGLGSCYVNRVLKGLGEAGDHVKAEEAFTRALSLDPKILEARLHRIFIYLTRGEKQRARADVRLLREEYPNDVGVQFAQGVLARLDGQYDRALRSFQKMVRLNPDERIVASYNRSRIFMYQGRYDEALAELDKGAAVEPDHPLIRTFRARVLYYKGEVAKAEEILREVLEQHPRMDGIRPILAMCLSAQGRHNEADQQLTKRVREAAAADHDIPYWLASAYLLQGRQVEAFRWLEAAIESGNENYPWFQLDPNWLDLHDDPRFSALMQKIQEGRQQSKAKPA